MKYFKLYSNCKVVTGYTRSLLCDLHRNEFVPIPNALSKILQEDKININKLIRKFKDKDQIVLNEYFEYLLDNEYGFITEDINNFPALDNQWRHPSGLLTNAIIECDNMEIEIFKSVVTQITSFGCKNIELRFYENILYDHLVNLLDVTNESIISFISLVIPNSSINETTVEHLIEAYGRIGKMIIHSADNSSISQSKDCTLILSEESIFDNSVCGKVSISNFACNVQFYSESKNYNSCLNGKISITNKGEIKNCPSMKQSFGKISINTIQEVLADDAFVSLWNITKEHIEVCKDCEFRMVCQDCRAYTLDGNNKLSKPLKCKYNPYTGKWN